MESDEEKIAIFVKCLAIDCMNDYVPTIGDIVLLNRTCLIVSSRAATLAGAGIKAIIERQNILTISSDFIIIGVSG